MKPKKLEILPFGVSLSFGLDIIDYNKKIFKANLLELKKIVVAIAGPLVNFILIIYFLHFNINIVSNDIIVYANILILIFNLIPIYPLDGGRILKSMLHIIWGGKKAKKIINKVSNITMWMFTAFGLFVIYYYKNIAILFIIIFLWYLVIKENKKFKYISKVYNL